MPFSLPEPVSSVARTAARLGDEEQIRAVALVGSHARGTAGPGSDVDLVVLTRDPSSLLDHDQWLRRFDPLGVVTGRGDFGALQERRLRLSSGLVVEIGVGHPSWAAVDPLDPGTRRVVRDGLVVLHDPDGLLRRLLAAVRALD